jgi:hypothetical protein
VSLLIDNRAAIGANPGVHAFIIGVSSYPFLGGGATPVADPWGLGQLTSAASSAHAVFEWLKTATMSAPLATCRVLLSPSAAASEAPLAGLTKPATFDNVFAEAHDWRQDAASHQANVTVFYFAGHGVQRNKEDAVLCLQDLREPPGGPVRRAIDVERSGSRREQTSSEPDLARKDS